MGKAIGEGHEVGAHETRRDRDWRKAMSDNVALALIAYTILQIFVTVHALKEGTSSTLPYFALVILVAGIIPACRWFEKRWKHLSDSEAADEGFRADFRRDQLLLWGLALGLPFLLTFLFKAIIAVSA